MSILETPRLSFRGRIIWDPIAATDCDAVYDENTVAGALLPGEVVEPVRASAIGSATNGDESQRGAHRSRFSETKIVSVDTGSGPTADDALVGSSVELLGMLVDADPHGAYTSQMFFDAMSFGVDGGCQIRAARSQRMSDRYVNYHRNLTYRCIGGVASTLWQTSFPKENLTLAAHDSAAISAIVEALQAPDVLGLTVRWCSYKTIYSGAHLPSSGRAPVRSMQVALQQKLRCGFLQPNPARSEIVGTLGLWRRGEPATVPGDRALLAQVNAGGEYAAATSFARVSKHAVTIDLSNSVKETGRDLVKQDLGTLSVVLLDAQGEAVGEPLGELPYSAYDRTSYDFAAGLVTLPLDARVAEAAARQPLGIVDAKGNVLLAETALRACPDQANVYLDAGEASSLQVLVLHYGAPVDGDAVVTMAPQGASADQAVTAKVTGGVATLPIGGPGVDGSVVGYVLLPTLGSAPARVSRTFPMIDPQLTDFYYLRTLPADDAIGKLTPTWANVYAYVLSEWRAMSPFMDNWLRLDDHDQVRRYADVMRRFTDKSSFEALRYMPVTRDLSAGKRALLHAWLSQPAARRFAATVAAQQSHIERRLSSQR